MSTIGTTKRTFVFWSFGIVFFLLLYIFGAQLIVPLESFFFLFIMIKSYGCMENEDLNSNKYVYQNS